MPSVSRLDEVKAAGKQVRAKLAFTMPSVSRLKPTNWG